jgi:hypothetical protein
MLQGAFPALRSARVAFFPSSVLGVPLIAIVSIFNLDF